MATAAHARHRVDDLATARALIATLHDQLTTTQRENASLRHQLDVLCQRLVREEVRARRSAAAAARARAARQRAGPGHRADRDGLGRDAGARACAAPADGAAAAARASAAPPRRDRRRRTPTSSAACGHTKTRIGESVAEKLEYEPASFVVIETVRGQVRLPALPRRRRRSAGAAAGGREIARGRRAAGARGRVEVRRSPAAPSARADLRARGRRPVARRRCATGSRTSRRRSRRSASSCAARSPPPTTCRPTTRPSPCSDDRGGSFKGRLWTYLDPLGRQVVFDATADARTRRARTAFLADFRGQAPSRRVRRLRRAVSDGARPRDRLLGPCAAPLRRGLHDRRRRRRSMMALIQQLYRGRARRRGPHARRRGGRAARSSPCRCSRSIDAERARLAAHRPAEVARSATPCAISRISGPPCSASSTDGRLAIDNNRAENQLRVVAVGRKNWLFAGSFEGARRAALLYSLVQSCKLIDVSPFDYLKDVLVRVATHPQRLIHQLTPRGWADTFGPHASV